VLRCVIAKDLRRWWSDRNAVIVALLLPLVLTGILGVSFGGFGDGAGISVIPLAVVGDLPTLPRQFLDDALRGTGLFDVTWTTREQAERMVRTGAMRAALIVPDDLTSRFVAGEEIAFTLWKDINSEYKAGIVEQILARMLLYWRAGEAAYFGAWPEDWYPRAGESDAFTELLDGASTLEVYEAIRDGAPEAETAWERVKTLLDHQVLLQDAFDEPAVVLKVDAREDMAEPQQEPVTGGRNMFGFFLPGMAVFFLMFSAGTAGGDIHVEREGGTLQRMLVTPLSAQHMLLGKWAFATANGLLQLMVLFAAGKLFYRLNLGPDPLALPVQALATSAALASIFLVLGLLTNSAKQTGQISTGIILFMAIVGGNFMSPEAMPDFIRGLARFMPNFWANQGFTAIVTRDQGLGAVTTNLLILGGMAIVGLGAAVLLLRRRQREGGLL
jgi:ABC-2 type transport system permease protein